MRRTYLTFLPMFVAALREARCFQRCVELGDEGTRGEFEEGADLPAARGAAVTHVERPTARIRVDWGDGRSPEEFTTALELG
jgi:hypothetical protein